MHMLSIQLSFRQETKEIVPKQRPLLCPIFFLDRSQNYESNGISFKNFGALNRELKYEFKLKGKRKGFWIHDILLHRTIPHT
jgi:hypothetical protein